MDSYRNLRQYVLTGDNFTLGVRSCVAAAAAPMLAISSPGLTPRAQFISLLRGWLDANWQF